MRMGDSERIMVYTAQNIDAAFDRDEFVDVW
jgi:hypothetical protein